MKIMSASAWGKGRGHGRNYCGGAGRGGGRKGGGWSEGGKPLRRVGKIGSEMGNG